MGDGIFHGVRMLFMAEPKARGGTARLIRFIRLGLFTIEAFFSVQTVKEKQAQRACAQDEREQVLPDECRDFFRLHDRVCLFSLRGKIAEHPALVFEMRAPDQHNKKTSQHETKTKHQIPESGGAGGYGVFQ